MLCCVCKKNQADKICEMNSDGKTVREYYCADCYRRLFESAKRQSGTGADGGGNKRKREDNKNSGAENKAAQKQKARCPFCGTTVTDYESTRLFGCPECYRYLFGYVEDEVVVMQGDEPHAGKNPQAQNTASAATRNNAGVQSASAIAAARAKEKGRM